MVITEKILLRKLKRRTNWVRPEDALKRLAVQRLFLIPAPVPDRNRKLRERARKRNYENYQCALFAYGIHQLAPDCELEYSYGEDPSYREADCFIRCKLPPEIGDFVYKPVQVKELVAKPTSKKSLREEVNELAEKYSSTAGQEILVVAYYVNRATAIQLREFEIPPSLHIQQLWFFGRTSNGEGFVTGGNLRVDDKNGWGTQKIFQIMQLN